MFALAALNNWYITALDVKSAFLYGKLDEEIYMEQPEGFKIKGLEHKVLRLQRSIYGLKQSALSWWKALHESMKKLGFVPLSSDAGIFIRRQGSTYVIVYVDDSLFLGPNKDVVDKAKADFMKMWECTDLGEPKEFLRMRVKRKGCKIYLDQSPYLHRILKRFNMSDAKAARTPLPAGYFPQPNKEEASPALRSRYQTVIGSLLYLMLGTRPDIAYAVTKLSQHCTNPSQEHLDKALYICRYLAGTKDYSLIYDGDSEKGILAYTDSDWGSDPTSCKSQTGYFIKLANGIFSWNSHAQKTVALSSTEAEYMALSDCSRQVVWIKSLLAEMGIPLQALPICADNQGSIFIGSNPVQEHRSKHIDICYHYVRECIENGKVEISFIDGNDNPADMFTKNLGHIKFLCFRELLGLKFYPS